MEITKTDFLRYLEAPMHLWAEKHDRIEHELSPYELHLFEQGKEIEKLGKQFLATTLAGLEITQEQTFTDGPFWARVDALVYDPAADAYDMYEIKSASSIRKEHTYDVAFQYLVCAASIPVRGVYIVHINKAFVRRGEVTVDELFVVEDVTEAILALEDEIAAARQSAWEVVSQNEPVKTGGCLKPKTCPCPALCHPVLPEHPIFDIPRLHHNKARLLLDQGILAIQDIPADFALSERQSLHVQAVKQGGPLVDAAAIRAELGKLVYPLYFLDYETYNPAVPFYDGYRPYQHMVFQYSLHVIAAPGGEPEHFECLVTDKNDPGRQIAEHLAEHIGETGTVIVWNKAFEAGRNQEMAAMYPEYSTFLLGVNDRIYDLMDCFSKGYYVHPDFHGSASIKQVLPVLVQDHDLDYEGLPIPQGDAAMLAWVSLMAEFAPVEHVEQTRKDLLCYCELDTLAMVRNWQALAAVVG
ncbi:MAG: DUF2779 domain-containing protein [Anaerolineales bacterium]|nr:DUF2779 domain-containing protein [Anaerolineales bacterium]